MTYSPNKELVGFEFSDGSRVMSRAEYDAEPEDGRKRMDEILKFAIEAHDPDKKLDWFLAYEKDGSVYAGHWIGRCGCMQ